MIVSFIQIDYILACKIKLYMKFINGINHSEQMLVSLKITAIWPRLLEEHGSHSTLFVESGSFRANNPPIAIMVAVNRMGMALLTAMKFPKATFPRMAAILPRQD